MIADNKIFSLGIENLDTLNDFLVDLQGDLEIPGFDEEILRQMVSDAEEVTEKIAEYGTLDDEEIRTIRENNERREQRQASVTATSDNGNSEASQVEYATADDEPTTEQRFVICSNCGEKVWL